MCLTLAHGSLIVGSIANKNCMRLAAHTNAANTKNAEMHSWKQTTTLRNPSRSN